MACCRIAIWGLLTLLATAPIVFAQGQAYKLGAGDVVTVLIYAGGEKQNEANLTVSNAGTINVPLIGGIKAAGLSSSELEAEITKPLAVDYFVDPTVHVAIKEYHHLQYYISGAVKKPGLYKMEGKATLLELIAKAEGTLPDRGDQAHVMRGEQSSKESQPPITVDLHKLLDEGDMTANLTLQTGDVVYIPLQKSQDVGKSKIYVEGEVKRPGLYDFQPGITALKACIMAGGFDRFAAPNRARLIRQKEGANEVIKINLEKVKDGIEPDVTLQPGDRIHVPESWL